uniref:Phospholipid/glycerol acyltransferase domain-containing protein n=1 Tax=Noctiluca scintillans TaxID=2966 RepID=A0A7S1FHX8_NOCSC
MESFDPLFASDYTRTVHAIWLERSPFRRLLHKWSPNRGEFGIILSVLVVLLGFRQSRGRLARHIARNTEDVDADAERLQRSTPRWAPRLAMFGEHYLEKVLMTLLGYKLLILVLFTMPSTYYFGIKRRFLRWASRASLFRLYLQFMPVVGCMLVGLGTVTVQFSKRAPQPGVVGRWQMLSFLNLFLGYSTSRLFELIRGDPQPLFNLEESAADRDLLSTQPSRVVTGLASLPITKFSPICFQNLDHIPTEKSRLLFVGNHAIWGLDTVPLMAALREETGICLRTLGEHSIFALPGAREVMKMMGAVDGTRHNCDLLMSVGENILVYPGGARESWRRTTDEMYSLHWGEHVGFAAMAVRHGYTIIPTVSVGMEDVWCPVYDLPIDKLTTGGGLIEMPAGASKAFEPGAKFPIIAPKPWQAQKNYFRFMRPISTDAFKGQEGDIEVLRQVRDETRIELLKGIQEVLEFRESDPDRYVLRSRWGSKAASPAARL